jgi:hypothetical protein
MRFTLKGAVVDVTREEAESRLAGVLPEPVQTHGVRVGRAPLPWEASARGRGPHRP